MKHILAGTAEQIGGMTSESSKVVMGMILCYAMLYAKSHQSCLTLCDPIDDSPGKNTGVGCHFLLQCM